VWVNSESSTTEDIQYDGSDLSIPGDESDRFWLYTDKDASAAFRGIVFGSGTDN